MTPDQNGGEPTTPPDPNNPTVTINVTYAVKASDVGPERNKESVEGYNERVIRGGTWGRGTVVSVTYDIADGT